MAAVPPADSGFGTGQGDIFMRQSSFGRITALVLAAIPLILRAQPLAEGHDKFLGNIIGDPWGIPANFDAYWNQVTPENHGKWATVEGVRDRMDWAGLDVIYAYAKDRGLPFRWHAFVWGQQYPSWITKLTPDEQRAEVEEWIALFGARYPDTDFVDVVNEPFSAPPPFKEALGGNGATGWDWVVWCFEKARRYMPNAQLHINEYGILNGWKSVDAYARLARLLKGRGLIDGIGEQGHFLESTGASAIGSKLRILAAEGLPVYITEYDVKLADNDAQRETYRQQFPVFWENPAVRGVTLWGYVQGSMWRTEAFLVRRDGSERPALEWLREYLADLPGSGVGGNRPVLSGFQLFQNHPNPFNPATHISFTLGAPGIVRLDVFDMTGRTVATLLHGAMTEGPHAADWSGTADSGEIAASGLYGFRLIVSAAGRTGCATRKMMIVR